MPGVYLVGATISCMGCRIGQTEKVGVVTGLGAVGRTLLDTRSFICKRLAVEIKVMIESAVQFPADLEWPRGCGEGSGVQQKGRREAGL